MKRKGFLFLGVLVVIGGAAFLLYSRSSTSNAHLIDLELGGTPVSYSEIETLEDGSLFQYVVLGKDNDPEADAFGVSTYPNPQRLSAEEWVRQEWDLQGLMILENFPVPFGNAIVIRDANAWADTQQYLVDFPVLAVASTDDQIIIVNRLSGVDTTLDRILEIFQQAREP